MRREYFLPLIYLGIMGFFIALTAPFGADDFPWFFASMVLTLPWSIVTFIFIMGALHSGDEIGILVTLGIKALMNAALIYWIARPRTTQSNKA